MSGRLKDAWRALFAAEPSKQTLLAEWQEMKLEWTSTLDKLNKWADRQRKRDERALKKNLEELQGDVQQMQQELPLADSKEQLRSRAAELLMTRTGRRQTG